MEVLGKVTSRGAIIGEIFEIASEDGTIEGPAHAGYAEFGRRRREELHWAGVLGTPMRFTLKEDPDNPGVPERGRGEIMTLLDFQKETEATIAEQVSAHPGPDILEQANGLSAWIVDAAANGEYSRHGVGFVERRKIICWRDGSVNIVECGSTRKQVILPPLGGLADLCPNHDEQRDRERELVDFTMLLRSCQELTAQANHRAAREMEALLRPTLELAAWRRMAISESLFPTRTDQDNQQ